jgi:hypothetical protein
MIFEIYVFVLNKNDHDIKIYDSICKSLSSLFAPHNEAIYKILNIIGKLTYKDHKAKDEVDLLKLILHLFIDNKNITHSEE